MIVFLHRALQIPPEAWLRMSLNNGSISYLVIRPTGNVCLRLLGDSGFMPPEKISRTWVPTACCTMQLHHCLPWRYLDNLTLHLMWPAHTLSVPSSVIHTFLTRLDTVVKTIIVLVLFGGYVICILHLQDIKHICLQQIGCWPLWAFSFKREVQHRWPSTVHAVIQKEKIVLVPVVFFIMTLFLIIILFLQYKCIFMCTI